MWWVARIVVFGSCSHCIASIGLACDPGAHAGSRPLTSLTCGCGWSSAARRPPPTWSCSRWVLPEWVLACWVLHSWVPPWVQSCLPPWGCSRWVLPRGWAACWVLDSLGLLLWDRHPPSPSHLELFHVAAAGRAAGWVLWAVAHKSLAAAFQLGGVVCGQGVLHAPMDA